MNLIKRIREAVKSYEELSDPVKSDFLRKHGFTQKGFKFMALEKGFMAKGRNMAVFEVPSQKTDEWYSDGVLTEEKKNIAEEISKKYSLELGTPYYRYFHFMGNLFYEEHGYVAKANQRYLAIAIESSEINLDTLFEDLCRLYL